MYSNQYENILPERQNNNPAVILGFSLINFQTYKIHISVKKLQDFLQANETLRILIMYKKFQNSLNARNFQNS